MGNLTVKESGEMASFISPNVNNITSFKVYFSPKQEGKGDPSPENVREITGWNSVEGYSSGKNLFDSSKIINNKRLNQYGELLTNAEDVVSDYIKVQPLNTYTISGFGILAFNERHCWYDKDKNYLKASANMSSDVCTLTVPSDAEYVRLTIKNDYIESTQIELGSQATSYEPYQTTTTSTDWTEDVGTVYGGYVDLISGELVNEYASITLTGAEEGWQFYGTEIEGGHIFSNSKVTNRIGGTQRRTEEFCTHFPMSRNWKTTLNTCIVGESGLIGFSVDNSIAETVEEFTQFLSEQYANGTPVRLVYKIYVSYYANYTTYQLTPQQLSTLKGQNNFWSNADYIEIEYELTETFDIQKAKRKIILNQPHVESASGDLVTFDTDMKGKLKECKVYFSPVQEGEGDPSPDNVREITGWNGVEGYLSRKNIGHVFGYSAINLSDTTDITDYKTTNKYGTTINTTTFDLPDTELVIEQSQAPNSTAPSGYQNGYIAIGTDNLIFGQKYNVSFKVSNITNNILNVSLNNIKLLVSNGVSTSVTEIIDDVLIFKNITFYQNTTTPKRQGFEIRICGMSFTLSEFMVTAVDNEDFTYEPYQGTTTSIDWTDEAGTVYGGYIDLVSGELVVNRCFLENEDWTEYKRNNGFVAYRLSAQPASKGANQICKPISNIISNFKNFSSNNMTENVMQINGASLYVALAEGIDTSEIQLSYELAEPIHYTLTPQQILTLKGTNNVYSDTNGQIEIKYWKH